jgi:hypothetical protein
MAACEVGGALMTFMGHMGLAFGKILRVRGSFLVILDLR